MSEEHSHSSEEQLEDWQQVMIDEFYRNVPFLKAHRQSPFGIQLPLFTDRLPDALIRLSWFGMHVASAAIIQDKLVLELPDPMPVLEDGQYWLLMNPPKKE